MKIKDIFARFAGGAVGVALAVTVPHIGCLAALTPVFVSVGAGATLATGATYVGGAVLLAGGAAAAWYGLTPSREACCQLWGETTKMRALKGAAMAACAFMAVALVNTVTDSGFDVPTRAILLENAQKSGQSVWEAQNDIDLICGKKQSWFTP